MTARSGCCAVSFPVPLCGELTRKQSYSANFERMEREQMNSQERHEARYRRRRAAREAKRAEKVRSADDFDKVFTYSHLYDSYEKCLRNVRWKGSVQTYKANAPINVYKAFSELQKGTLKHHRGYEFDIYERGKKRHIRSVHIRERVVQKCLCDYALVPVLGRTLIYDNGASTKNKGTQFARNRLMAHLERYIRKYGPEGYILTFDFKKFFDSIQHSVIEEVMRKNFRDERIIELTMQFVRVSGDVGLGLGSQISQSLCLAVPNTLDHAMKEKCRMKSFARFMDDGHIISNSKEKLRECLAVMKEICSRLKLTINTKKTHIKKLSAGFTFLKWRYHVLPTGKIIRRPAKCSIVRMRRKLKKFYGLLKAGKMSLKAIARSYESWCGSIRRTRCWRSKNRMDELFRQLFGVSHKEVFACYSR